MSNCSGRSYHKTTKHSWISVRQNPNRLDWDNQPRFPKFTFHKQAWEETILKRRSIREFSGKSITKAQFEAIMEIVE